MTRAFTLATAFRFLLPLALVLAVVVRADQVEMSNGDRYVGRVLSLGSDTLVLQSEVLGTMRLPRARISVITLAPVAAKSGTNLARSGLSAPRSNGVSIVSAASSTNAATEFSAAMRQLGSNSNLIQQVQDQLLTGTGPEAQAKFNDLLGGLLSGKVDLDQLRAEAKSTLDQARRARNDLGEQGGAMLDSYLAILDSFLKETEPAAGSTNSPSSTARSKPEKPAEAE